MKIYNTTTGEPEELRYAPNGSDAMPDLIAGDGTIRLNPDTDTREANQESIDYWRDWVTRSEQADALEDELARRVGIIEADQVSAQAVEGLEFSDHPQGRIIALRKDLASLKD